jgi:hypothetical protein
VTSSQLETAKVGKDKRAKKETVVGLGFSGGLNAASADNTSAYGFASITKVPAKGKGKNRKPAMTKLGSLVSVASAAYNPSNNTVTLTPRFKLNASKAEELIVDGALLTDVLGRGIDGDDDGVAGSNHIATITGTRVVTGGIPLARIQQQTATVTDAVDRLLASGKLVRPKRPARISITPDRLEP